MPSDMVDKEFFAMCTHVTLGCGKRCSFWFDSWMGAGAKLPLGQGRACIFVKIWMHVSFLNILNGPAFENGL